MTPPVEIRAGKNWARLYCADCLTVLPTLEAESVHVTFMDPPYGHSNGEGDLAASRVGVHGARQEALDVIANDGPEDWAKLMPATLTELARVLKADCCCCCCCCCGGGGPSPAFATMAQWLDEYLSFFHAVVWDKSARGNGLGWRYRRNYEFVMVAHRKGGKLAWADNDVAVPNINRSRPVPNDEHPTTKPLELVADFLSYHATPDQTILDPFMGSGTTGVAALRHGCNFIGIEIEPKYFEIAKRRIRAEAAQGKLF